MPSNAAEQKQQINADKNTNIHNDNYYIIYRFGTGSSKEKKKNEYKFMIIVYYSCYAMHHPRTVEMCVLLGIPLWSAIGTINL